MTNETGLKVPSLCNHQRTADQMFTKIPPRSSEKGHHQGNENDKTYAGMDGGQGSLPALLLVGAQTNEAILEISLGVSQKIGH